MTKANTVLDKMLDEAKRHEEGRKQADEEFSHWAMRERGCELLKKAMGEMPEEWEKPDAVEYVPMKQTIETVNMLGAEKEASDGATASYYELPKGAEQLQDLIAYLNLNAQLGEIFRACYRYGRAAHSDRLRDAKKIAFYAAAEIKRLETYGDS